MEVDSSVSLALHVWLISGFHHVDEVFSVTAGSG